MIKPLYKAVEPFMEVKSGYGYQGVLLYDDIADRLQRLAGSEGLDLSQIMSKAVDDSSSVQDIRSRSVEVSHSLELLGAVVEKRLGGSDDPVVATFPE